MGDAQPGRQVGVPGGRPQSLRSSIGAPAHRPPRDDPDAFRRDVLDHLRFTAVKDPRDAGPDDLYRAMAHSVRDRLVHRWLATQRTYTEHDVKRVC